MAYYIIDIDHFKSINDQYGHVVGDDVLRQLAKEITLVKRKADQLFRIGGEEFCLLALNIDKNSAYTLAEDIRKCIEQTQFEVDGVKIVFSVSIGLAIYPITVSNIYELKEKADKALYLSKSSGRNKVTIV